MHVIFVYFVYSKSRIQAFSFSPAKFVRQILYSERKTAKFMGGFLCSMLISDHFFSSIICRIRFRL